MSTRRDSWRSILDTRNDVDRMVAAAVGDYPNQIPVRPSGAGGGRLHGSAMGPEPESVPFQEPTWQATLGDTTQVTPSPTAKDGAADGAAAREINEQELQVLRDLQVGVSKRLDGLSAALAQELGRDDAMKALSIYFDERILDRLPDFMRPSWPLLQKQRTHSVTGGEDFYRVIDHLRATAGTPSFVFEVHYFCLANGFVGRYANDLDSIEEYRHRLQETITVLRVPSDTSDTAEVRIEVTKPVSTWVPYAFSLGVVVLSIVSITAASNF